MESEPQSGRDLGLSLTGACWGLALLGLAGALASAGFLPIAVERIAGGLLFFVAAAWPLLLRLSPVTPSLLKALTLSAQCSPVLATSIYLLARLGLEAPQAVTLTFIVLAALQLLALGRRVTRPPIGRAAWCALALSGLTFALVLLLLFNGNAPRASYHGLLHSALLLAVDHSVPPAHPWMAGHELGYYWFWHAMGALFSRAFHIAPTFGLALTNLWAASLLPLVLYFTAAPCFRDGKREILGVLLALFGLNALGGFVWWRADTEWLTPENTSELLRTLRQSVGLWDSRLAFGFSKFGNLSSYPTALTLLAGGWMCAVHAIRHGEKPWVGTMAALHGAALAVNPVVGGVGLACTGLGALLAAPSLRVRLLLPLIGWALPGAWLTYLAGRSYAGESVRFQWSDGGLWATAAPVLLLLIPVLLLWMPAKSGKARAVVGTSRAIRLLLTAGLLPLAMHLLVLLPYANEYKLIRIAALPLGLLAAASLVNLIESGGWQRLLGGALALSLLWGTALSNGLGFASYLGFAKIELPLAEEPMHLFPRVEAGANAQSNELATLYRWLANSGEWRGQRPILIVNCPSESAPLYGERRPTAFTDPLRNLQGHEAAPFTGLQLWCDRPSQVLSQSTPGWEERYRLLFHLYAGGGMLSEAEQNLLLEENRPMLLLMTPQDRRAHRGEALRGVIESLGFQSAKKEGRTEVFAWPAAFAESLGGKQQ